MFLVGRKVRFKRIVKNVGVVVSIPKKKIIGTWLIMEFMKDYLLVAILVILVLTLYLLKNLSKNYTRIFIMLLMMMKNQLGTKLAKL